MAGEARAAGWPTSDRVVRTPRNPTLPPRAHHFFVESFTVPDTDWSDLMVRQGFASKEMPMVSGVAGVGDKEGWSGPELRGDATKTVQNSRWNRPGRIWSDSAGGGKTPRQLSVLNSSSCSDTYPLSIQDNAA